MARAARNARRLVRRADAHWLAGHGPPMLRVWLATSRERVRVRALCRALDAKLCAGRTLRAWHCLARLAKTLRGKER